MILKTTAEATQQDNGLRFRLGPVVPGAGTRWLMKPVLWEFHNDTDWSLEQWRVPASARPNCQGGRPDSALLRRVGHENEEPAAGDYILQGTPQSESRYRVRDSHDLRQRHAAEYLYLGSARGRYHIVAPCGPKRNQVVSNRVAGVVEDNDIEFTVFGPVEWDVNRMGSLVPG